MERSEKRICWYSSLLITLFLNSGKLLTLRENGLIGRRWHFHLADFSFQVLFDLGFCLLLCYLYLVQDGWFRRALVRRPRMVFYLLNGLLVLLAILTGGLIQYVCFPINRAPVIYWGGYVTRIVLSAVLVGIIIKLLRLSRESRTKAVENEKLKHAYSSAELALLKTQINPHFLFNQLSCLSGIIREDPDLARHYVLELSKVFRYSLWISKTDLVTLAQELTVLRSFAELVRMRLEKAFELDIRVAEDFLSRKLPHLSLQPLLDNAVKHNSVSADRPLRVDITVEDGWLLVRNSLFPLAQPAEGTGLGLANLNDRFRIMMQAEIEIKKTAAHFLVKLPLHT